MDIVAIGDAIVDVIATCEDSFLESRGFEKGSLRAISADDALALYSAIGPARESSGGSAANSIAGCASLGLKTAFIGQVADDQLGAVFAEDMRAIGVQFETPALKGPPPTGVCLILVTPDGQRTMNSYAGASRELTIAAVAPERIRSAAITFLEGYLWGPTRPRAAMLEAARIAQAAGRTVAFTLSESLRVGDCAKGVRGMIEAGLVDLVFGNEQEMRHLSGSKTLTGCIDTLAPHVKTLVITRSGEGAIGVAGSERIAIAAVPAERVVDTTGAGDQFAAGFIAAHCRGRPLKACLEAGAIVAAEVISHFGARPERDLKSMIAS